MAKNLKVMKKMVLLFQLLLVLLVGYGGLVLFMYVKQEAFLFFPPSAHHEVDGGTGVVAYSLDRGGTTLKGWLVNPQYRRDKLIIYYGGNAEDIYFNVDDFEAIQAATLLVAYRGYGPSEGRPGEAEIFSDALAIIDDMVSQYNPERIFLMGRSLGSGVACYVGSQRTVHGLILVTPYDTITRVAQSAYPWLPVETLLKHRFESVRFVKKISAPSLILYGGRDTIVRPERTKLLMEQFEAEKQVVFIPQADHGTIEMYPEYWDSILAFIN